MKAVNKIGLILALPISAISSLALIAVINPLSSTHNSLANSADYLANTSPGHLILALNILIILCTAASALSSFLFSKQRTEAAILFLIVSLLCIFALIKLAFFVAQNLGR